MVRSLREFLGSDKVPLGVVYFDGVVKVVTETI
jgi:hypothetical protein